jgi:hypothetical protein
MTALTKRMGLIGLCFFAGKGLLWLIGALALAHHCGALHR